MSVADLNYNVFKHSMDVLRRNIGYYVMDAFEDIARKLIKDFLKYKGFQSFTGNTLLSFMAGVYQDGRLWYVYTITDEGLKPIRKKIPKGKRIYLKHPMQGNPRMVTGKVTTTDEYGPETSKRFLESFAAPKKKYCLVIVIGTEYYSLIDFNLSSMTRSFNTAQSLSNSKLIEELKLLPYQVFGE